MNDFDKKTLFDQSGKTADMMYLINPEEINEGDFDIINIYNRNVNYIFHKFGFGFSFVHKESSDSVLSNIRGSVLKIVFNSVCLNQNFVV